MIIRLLPLLLLALALYWLYRRLAALPAPTRRIWLMRIAVGTFLTLLFIAFVTGRLNWLGALLMAVIPFVTGLWRWLNRGLSLLRIWKSMGQAANPLHAAGLHLQTDATDGDVLAGPHAGQTLSSLAHAALEETLTYFQAHDAAAAKLLRLYLLKRFGPDWQGSPLHEQDTNDMSLAEARALLGVAEHADKQTIIQAHRKLIQKFHPDRGGNDYLAARINQAKALLLDQLESQNQ
ncbi:molecular chaperone DnaJ [Simiduia aestuariiviva]|uniref:Spy/CpxP family protein refolding chaperone n=1 Tax=Simiduia aestuariiviva TaxID=1510459 RepID=A0A839UQA6_9GAMM|nr:molecular chaperone DnaJ [Simiduia aestuariiviva]MBB3168659.1 Spy/CpxP family protein refolding chaperone [Simiduia aestuariiviva]